MNQPAAHAVLVDVLAVHAEPLQPHQHQPLLQHQPPRLLLPLLLQPLKLQQPSNRNDGLQPALLPPSRLESDQ